MSKKYLLLILTVLFSVLAIFVFKNSNNLLSIDNLPLRTNSNIEDISDKFVLTPNKEYSLSDKNIIIPADTLSLPGIPERIEIKTKVNNSFPKPLWGKGKDCNHHGVLEKKQLRVGLLLMKKIVKKRKS